MQYVKGFTNTSNRHRLAPCPPLMSLGLFSDCFGLKCVWGKCHSEHKANKSPAFRTDTTIHHPFVHPRTISSLQRECNETRENRTERETLCDSTAGECGWDAGRSRRGRRRRQRWRHGAIGATARAGEGEVGAGQTRGIAGMNNNGAVAEECADAGLRRSIEFEVAVSVWSVSAGAREPSDDRGYGDG